MFILLKIIITQQISLDNLFVNIHTWKTIYTQFHFFIVHAVVSISTELKSILADSGPHDLCPESIFSDKEENSVPYKKQSWGGRGGWWNEAH